MRQSSIACDVGLGEAEKASGGVPCWIQGYEGFCVNDLSRFAPHIEQLVERLSGHVPTVGIVLLGGLGRRAYLDDYSDLDLAIFVDRDDAAYLPPFSFHLCLEGRNVEFNVTQQNINYENYTWDEAKRSAYRNGIIVFDRGGALASLFARTLHVPDSRFEDELITSLNQMYWKGIYHAHSASARGYPETAHFLINEAVDLAVKSVFALNKTDRPHKKWQFSELQVMATMPARFCERIGELLVIKAITSDQAARRSALVESMARDLSYLAKLTFPAFPHDVYRYWAQFLSGRQISKNNVVDILTDLLSERCSSSSTKAMRGALSWAITTGPKTVGDIVACVRNDQVAPPCAIALLEEALNEVQHIALADLSTLQAKVRGK